MIESFIFIFSVCSIFQERKSLLHMKPSFGNSDILKAVTSLKKHTVFWVLVIGLLYIWLLDYMMNRIIHLRFCSHSSSMSLVCLKNYGSEISSCISFTNIAGYQTYIVSSWFKMHCLHYTGSISLSRFEIWAAVLKEVAKSVFSSVVWLSPLCT